MKEFYLSVISPGTSLYEGVATSIVVPTLSGHIGILPGHVPLVSVLTSGQIQIKNNSEMQNIPLSGGLLNVTQDKVIILSS